MTELEEWRDITGWEGFYQISCFGNVRSLERGRYVKQRHYSKPAWRVNKARVLKQALDGKGYPMVLLCKFGVTRQFTVHRLVANHFIPNPTNKPCVNHLDANRLNNRAANLEWCTVLENNQHTAKMGRGRRGKRYRSYFTEQEEETLRKLFDSGVGVTAISYQLGLKYDRVRYIHRLWAKRSPFEISMS